MPENTIKFVSKNFSSTFWIISKPFLSEPAPSDLGQLILSRDGDFNIMEKYGIEPIPNTLSTLANGEMFRRLVLDDIVDPEVNFIEWIWGWI